MGGATGSVLIVEDDPDLSAILATVVAGRGHELRRASNGQVALALVSERMPDVILLDVTMPVVSGKSSPKLCHGGRAFFPGSTGA